MRETNVFVLMPFDKNFKNVYFGIKAACEEHGMNCKRIDDYANIQGDMVERIKEEIEQADCIIADLSQNKPNVLFELGYAHGCRKYLISLTQDIRSLPFDVTHYQNMEYNPDDIPKLKDDLRRCLKSYENDNLRELETMKIEADELAATLPCLEIHFNGIKLQKHNPIQIKIDFSSPELIIELVNTNTEKVLHLKKCSQKIIAPTSLFVEGDDVDVIALNHYHCLVDIGTHLYVPPNGSLKQTYALELPRSNKVISEKCASIEYYFNIPELKIKYDIELVFKAT